MTRGDLWCIAGVALVLTGGAVWGRARSVAPSPAPDFERPSQGGDYSVWHPGDAPGGIAHPVGVAYSWVARDVFGSVVTKHRYPAVCGSNGSALIAHGWGALIARAPQDPEWFGAPPSDVMW